MDTKYPILRTFKFQANLLYAESVLDKAHIDYQSSGNSLLVNPTDSTRAASIIDQLNLDESDVNEDNNGYIEGYTEWADKRFVSGYFTGGKIPLWMYDKTYAQFYGPFLIASGVLYLFLPLNVNTATFSDEFTSPGSYLPLMILIFYITCGILLTIRGFKK